MAFVRQKTRMYVFITKILIQNVQQNSQAQIIKSQPGRYVIWSPSISKYRIEKFGKYEQDIPNWDFFGPM